jgi:hypothetical protein
MNPELFGIHETDPRRSGFEAGLAAASAEEYLRFFNGQRPSRVRELLELRLALLIEHVWKRVPDELVVAELFSLTLPEARSLIRTTRARHRTTAALSIRAECEEALRNARPGGDGDLLVICSDAVVEHMLAVLRSSGQQPPSPKRDPAGLDTWTMATDTFNCLCRILDIEAISVAAAPQAEGIRRRRGQR